MGLRTTHMKGVPFPNVHKDLVNPGDVTGLGTAGIIPLWDAPKNLTDSIIYQTAGNIDIHGNLIIPNSGTFGPAGMPSLLTLTAFGTISMNTTSSGEVLDIISTADSAAGADIRLYNSRAVGANNDQAGRVRFTASSDTGSQKEIAEIRGIMTDATNATPSGQLDVYVNNAGSYTSVAQFGPSALTLTGNIIMPNDGFIGLGSGVADQRVIFDNANDFILLRGSEVGIYGGSDLFMASGDIHFTDNVAESAIQNINNRWFSFTPSDDVTNGGTMSFNSVDAGVGTSVMTMHKNAIVIETDDIWDSSDASWIKSDGSLNTTFGGTINVIDNITVNSSVSGNTGLLLKNTNADASGSYLTLQKDSASPANDDICGNILFQSDNNAAAVKDYALIKALATDVTAGSEDGSIIYTILEAGGAIDISKMNANGFQIANNKYIGSVNTPQSINITTAGLVVFNNSISMPVGTSILMADGAWIGRASSGPNITFDDGNNYLEITGCFVGIGTATPDQLLDVVGGNIKLEHTTKPTLFLNRDNASFKKSEISFAQQDTVQFGMGIDLAENNTRNFFIFDIVADLSRFHIKSDGLTGINNSSPDEMLHVGNDVFNSNNYVKIQSKGGYKSGVKMLGGGSGVWSLEHDDNPADKPFNILYGASPWISIMSTGRIGINNSAPATSALLDLTSTTGALLVPRMSTAQRNALTAVNGMIIYNNTDNQFNFYENGSWVLK